MELIKWPRQSTGHFVLDACIGGKNEEQRGSFSWLVNTILSSAVASKNCLNRNLSYSSFTTHSKLRGLSVTSPTCTWSLWVEALILCRTPDSVLCTTSVVFPLTNSRSYPFTNIGDWFGTFATTSKKGVSRWTKAEQSLAAWITRRSKAHCPAVIQDARRVAFR